MHFKTLALTFVFASAGLAKKLDYDDIPQRCIDVCTPVAELELRCDDTNKPDNDFQERQCVCTAQDANTMIPNCATCIWENGGEFDNDAEELVRECGFNTNNAPTGVRPNGPMNTGGSPPSRPDGNNNNNNNGGGVGSGQGNPNNNGGQGNPNNNNGGQGNPNNVNGGQGQGQGNGVQGDGQGNGQGTNTNNQPIAQGSINAGTTPTAAKAAIAGGLIGFAAFFL